MSSWAPFFKSKHVGRHFCSHILGVREGFQRLFPDFTAFCPDFKEFCPDFHQIKILGVPLHPLHLRLLHQWLLHLYLKTAVLSCVIDM